jgi:hypothetical protein
MGLPADGNGLAASWRTTRIQASAANALPLATANAGSHLLRSARLNWHRATRIAACLSNVLQAHRSKKTNEKNHTSRIHSLCWLITR